MLPHAVTILVYFKLKKLNELTLELPSGFKHRTLCWKSSALTTRPLYGLDELTLSRPRPLSYRNQSIYLLRKSMDWFLCDSGPRLERVKQL